MRRRLLPLLLLGVGLLAACAGDVNKPTAVQALDPAKPGRSAHRRRGQPRRARAW
jgi:hypothetical protein